MFDCCAKSLSGNLPNNSTHSPSQERCVTSNGELQSMASYVYTEWKMSPQESDDNYDTSGTNEELKERLRDLTRENNSDLSQWDHDKMDEQAAILRELFYRGIKLSPSYHQPTDTVELNEEVYMESAKQHRQWEPSAHRSD